ncbi:MAG: FHA domain-containing protein, partial [Sandaracinus sp.]|nr:FHA domain-containing protein [Sandaracinus sp.]
MIRLEVLRGQEVGRTVESDQDLVRIGRADRNDLVVTDHHVSGEHASIAFNGE